MSEQKKEHPVCRYCGSTNISADAAVRYDINKNDWVLSAGFRAALAKAGGES